MVGYMLIYLSFAKYLALNCFVNINIPIKGFGKIIKTKKNSSKNGAVFNNHKWF
jgi:hypothetical protein